PAPSDLYTLSLHDALPIYDGGLDHRAVAAAPHAAVEAMPRIRLGQHLLAAAEDGRHLVRSEARDASVVVARRGAEHERADVAAQDRKSTRLNSSHVKISYA